MLPFLFSHLSAIETTVSGTTLTISGTGAVTESLMKGSGDYQRFTAVHILEGPTSLEPTCFANFVAAKSISVPKSVNRIISTAFRFCNSLERIDLDPENPFFALDSQGILYTKDMTQLIRCPPMVVSFTIPNTVVKILSQSLQVMRKTATFQVPNSVVYIEGGFVYDSYFKEVTFEKGSKIVSFNSSMWSYSRIETLHVPRSVTRINSGCCTFDYQLTMIVFEEGSLLNTICSNAFYITGLRALHLPENLVTIQPAAFDSCTSLALVNVSASVISLSEKAFAACPAISTIICHRNNPVYIVKDNILYDKNITVIVLIANSKSSLTIPATLTKIGDITIQTCQNMNEILVEPESKSFSAKDGVLYNYDKTKAIAVCGGLTTVNLDSNVVTIGTSCCYGLKSLSSFTMGPNVTTIEQKAFFETVKITSIVMSENLEKMGSYCFSRSKLTTITFLGSKLRETGEYCFSSTPLTSIQFGSGLENIVKHSFEYSSLQEITFDPNCKLSKITFCSFRSCTKLRSITIPASVYEIQEEAFKGDTSLQEVLFAENSLCKNLYLFSFQNCGIIKIEFPNKLNIINNYAFQSCSSLTSVTFAAGSIIKTINPSSFMSCTKLATVTLPGSIEKIDASVFYKCTSLQSVEVEITNNQFKSDRGIVFTKDGSTIILVPAGRKSVTIANTISGIGPNAFFGCSLLVDLIFESGCSLQSIQENTFYECTSLTVIIIPDSVSTIEKEAFNSCSNLKNVTFAANSKLRSFGQGTFSGCISLTTVEFGTNGQLQTIGESTFKDCSKLEKITIPSTVSTIGTGAFSRCSSLKQIIFYEGSKLVTFSSGIFEECTSLLSFKYPDSITTITKGTFIGCPNLATIEFPDNMKINIIESNVFEGITSIKTIIISPTCTINTIKTQAFINLAITSITIPSVTTVESGIFTSCVSLQSVTIQKSLLSLSNNMFENCKMLNSISIPNTVQSIGSSCFKNCIALPSISITSTVSLGSNCFEGCTLFNNPTLTSISAISDSVFYKCTSLKTISIQGTYKSIGSNTFSECASLTSVSLKELETIGSSSFFNCKLLSSITLKGTFQELPSSLFEGCIALQTITHPKVLYIRSKCFKNCGLLRFTFSEGIINIDSESFYGCKSIKSLSLPNTITKVGSQAFRASGISGDLRIPDGTAIIESNAFVDTSLSFVFYCGSKLISGTKAFDIPVYVSSAYPGDFLCGEPIIKAMNSACKLISPSPTPLPATRKQIMLKTKRHSASIIILIIAATRN